MDVVGVIVVYDHDVVVARRGHQRKPSSLVGADETRYLMCGHKHGVGSIRVWCGLGVLLGVWLGHPAGFGGVQIGTGLIHVSKMCGG
jgi:hypothetical protein